MGFFTGYTAGDFISSCGNNGYEKFSLLNQFGEMRPSILLIFFFIISLFGGLFLAGLLFQKSEDDPKKYKNQFSDTKRKMLLGLFGLCIFILFLCFILFIADLISYSGQFNEWFSKLSSSCKNKANLYYGASKLQGNSRGSSGSSISIKF